MKRPMVNSGGDLHEETGACGSADGCRPVVVIDPETLPMDDLLRGLDRWHTWSSLTHEKTAIKALFDAIAAQTVPPKPDEPTGWGAVVEDRDGWYWTLVAPDSAAWANYGERGYRKYADITAIRVVGQGVQS